MIKYLYILTVWVYFNGSYLVSKYIDNYSVDKLEDFNYINNRLKEKESELEWLWGFSEAESLFYLSTKGALTFRIKLHWDDREALVYIQNLLRELANRTIGIIVDSKNQHESYYTIDKYKDIIEIIIPIFSKYFFYYF